MTVIIRADTHAQYGLFVTVLDTLKKLNIDKIAVATDVQ
ncbi:MAG: biopolymer transporter ExbD [Veillonellaceae bacterium]|nr:biopolymer transporter ExbD [Veillonellaceae bacterium]